MEALDDDQMGGDPTPIIISVTNEESKALLAVDHGVLDDILRNKISPAFLQQPEQLRGWYINCQRQWIYRSLLDIVSYLYCGVYL